jgi:hypothetical protein
MFVCDTCGTRTRLNSAERHWCDLCILGPPLEMRLARDKRIFNRIPPLVSAKPARSSHPRPQRVLLGCQSYGRVAPMQQHSGRHSSSFVIPSEVEESLILKITGSKRCLDSARHDKMNGLGREEPSALTSSVHSIRTPQSPIRNCFDSCEYFLTVGLLLQRRLRYVAFDTPKFRRRKPATSERHARLGAEALIAQNRFSRRKCFDGQSPRRKKRAGQ